MEAENIDRCKRFLEPDQLAQFERDHPNHAEAGEVLNSQLSVSEQILLKYKRSNDLRSFFESKYQGQSQEIRDLRSENAVLRGDIDRRDDKIREVLLTVESLESQIATLKDGHATTVSELKAQKAELSKELDFMSHEQNTKELQLSDLKSRLAKRSEELQCLKEGLNTQIQEVHGQFEEEARTKDRQIETLRA